MGSLSVGMSVVARTILLTSIMRCFTSENGSFSDKINYVDRNNIVLGYDATADCWEEFGHNVFSKIPLQNISYFM